MIKLNVLIRKKTYKTTQEQVLNNLDLSVKEGEFVSVIGPSGTGKTTLLNIIGGLDQDYNGEVFFNDRLSHELTLPINRSYMFQEPRLMPWLSVEENIKLVMNKEQLGENIIKKLIHDVELDDYSSAYPSALSGGMQRRVALARAFSINPELLLMDEPFVSLDSPAANRLRDYLMKIWVKMKPTVIFVTHDLREAILLSDRLVFLSNKPATVIKEINIDIKRPRSFNDSEVNKFYNNFLNEYPNLLDGYFLEKKQEWKIA